MSPNTAVGAKAGLFTDSGAAVPLAGVRVDAEISNLCARVEITQRFVNRECTPIEAVYVFPLDESAALCGFSAMIGSTLVVGEVMERSKAFETYDKALEVGHGAFLLDQERPDVFTASVGNVLPGMEVTLRLVYVTELKLEGSALRFVLPTTVSPRYAPLADRVGAAGIDAERVNPPVDWQVPYGLSLAVRLALPGGLVRVESPSHPIRVTWQDTQATVTLAHEEVALDRDFVLTAEASGLDSPRAWVEQDDDGRHAIALAFRPRLPVATVPAEILFVVDRSGSMGGPSIDEVRKALGLCLRSMTPGCKFNIVGFGSSFEALFPSSRSYDDASLRAASAHVGSLQADLGGTEILEPLRFALESPRDHGLTRQIVVLTDGQVTNTDAVLALVAEHSGEARIFTFGIGHGASHHLVHGLARAAGGHAEHISPGERIEPKVLRQFARIMSPALTDVRIDWRGIKVIQIPSSVPPVFDGGRLLVYAFTDGVAPASVRLMAASASGPVSFEVPIEPASVTRGRTVATLAARVRIRELSEAPGLLKGRGSLQRRAEHDGASEIVALARRYGLMSSETSYVAVEQRETPMVGDMKLRRVPVALTSGWGGLLDGSLRTLAAPRAARAMTLGHTASMADLSPAPAFCRAELEAPSMLQRTASTAARAIDHLRGLAARRPDSPPASGASGMDAIVALQRAGGWWDLDEALACALGLDVATLRALLPDGCDARRWATAVAIAWLERHAASQEDEWRLLVRKARQWLREAEGAESSGLLLDAAARFLAQRTAVV